MTSRSVIFFTISFLMTSVIGNVCGFLDLEELKSMSYEVSIVKTPVKLEQEPSPQVLYMTSKYGQQFQCKLPDVVVTQGEGQNRDSSQENIPNVLQLLEPMRKGPCLVKTKDWWTYDFCYGYFIRQYHVSDNIIDGPISILGVYDHDYNWNNQTHRGRSERIFQDTKNKNNRYHSQYYVNGTLCDLTGQPRKAEIRFYCEEDAGDYIYRVDEPETCAYVVTIHTARLCSHPFFKPVSDKSPHTISCSPMLPEDQYQEYLVELEEQKRIAEERRKAWIQKQQERVKSIRKLLDKRNSDASVGEGSDSGTKTEVEKPQEGVPEVAESEDNTISDHPEDVEKDDKDEKRAREAAAKFDQAIKELMGEQKDISDKYGKSIQDEIKKQFGITGDIVNEAEDDLQEIEDDAKNSAFNKLATTLNRLLDKLDKAEKHMAIATEELERAKHVMTKKDQQSKAAKGAGKDDEDAEVETEDSLIEEEDGVLKDEDDDEPEIIDTSDRLRVRLKKADGSSSSQKDGKLQMFQQHELDETQKKRLEKVVKEKLEQAGLETNGRRIEVKIITTGYYDDEDSKDVHILSEEETQQFQNMILTLLTGNQEAVQEMERQRRLEKNYEFVWGRSGLGKRKSEPASKEQPEEDK